MLQLDLLSVFDKESTPPTSPTTELRYRHNTSFFAKPTATLLENPLTKYTHGQPPTAFTRCNLLSKSVFFFFFLGSSTIPLRDIRFRGHQTRDSSCPWYRDGKNAENQIQPSDCAKGAALVRGVGLEAPTTEVHLVQRGGGLAQNQ